MIGISRYLGLSVLILGLMSVALGGVFVAQSISKHNYIRDRARLEQLTFGLDADAVARGEFVDSANGMQTAANTIAEHRRAIAPTYQSQGKFDPTNPTQLTYSQAINLENYLYLGVLSFGVTQLAFGSGIFMIVAGCALAAGGIALFGLASRKPQTA